MIHSTEIIDACFHLVGIFIGCGIASIFIILCVLIIIYCKRQIEKYNHQMVNHPGIFAQDEKHEMKILPKSSSNYKVRNLIFFWFNKNTYVCMCIYILIYKYNKNCIEIITKLYLVVIHAFNWKSCILIKTWFFKRLYMYRYLFIFLLKNFQRYILFKNFYLMFKSFKSFSFNISFLNSKFKKKMFCYRVNFEYTYIYMYIYIFFKIHYVNGRSNLNVQLPLLTSSSNFSNGSIQNKDEDSLCKVIFCISFSL